MRTDRPARALADGPPPDRAHALLARWRREPPGREVFEQLAAYGDGAALTACPALVAVLAEPGRASALAASLVRRFVPMIAAEPLARLPLRQSSHGPSASLLLGQAGRATLSLATHEPGRCDPATAGFADGERRDLVLAGTGGGIVVRLEDGAGGDVRLGREAIALGPGTALALDIARETLLVREVRTGLVTLRLVRVGEAPRPSREYRLSDGALLGQAAGDPCASRHELMLAALGRMGRSDAAPTMAAMTRGGCAHARWQALRECLALDTERGFCALEAMARDASDPLAGAAQALRARLLDRFPQLARIGAQPCPT